MDDEAWQKSLLIDDPENVNAWNTKVDSSENSSLFALDVMQKQDEGVEQIISAWKRFFLSPRGMQAWGRFHKLFCAVFAPKLFTGAKVQRKAQIRSKTTMKSTPGPSLNS